MQSNTSPTSRSELLSETLGNNHHICIGGKSVHNDKLVKIGILKIVDIIQNSGSLCKWDHLKNRYPALSASDYLTPSVYC